MGGMDDMGGGPSPAAAPEASHDERTEEAQGIIHIPKDMLPPGMSEKVKKGDVLEFRAIGPADADGDIPVEYNRGEEEKAPAWEDEFRAKMSPQKESAEPEVPEAGDGGGAGQGY